MFTLAAPPAAHVVLLQGTRVLTASVTEPIAFQLLADLVIPAGVSPPTAIGTLEYAAPQDDLFASTGLPNQEVVLPATPYLDGSAQVSAGNGAYVEVQNFLGSSDSDRHGPFETSASTMNPPFPEEVGARRSAWYRASVNWPPWWEWQLELTPHLEKRIDDRGFNEVDLRAMLEAATSYRQDIVDGRFVIETRHRRADWEVVVEPDEVVHSLVVITAYKVTP